MSDIKIIYVKPSNSSFILIDQKILEKAFIVDKYLVNVSKSIIRMFVAMLKLFFYLLYKGKNNDLFVTWFADYHAAIIVFVGKIYNKKVAIFLGGMDSINYPELHKGVFYKKYRGWFAKYALKNADVLLPNHESLIYHENYYYDEKGKKDGIKYYIPDLKTKIQVIHNGYDSDFFKRDYSISKISNLVLSIGKTNTIYDVINKGFDILVQLARRNPQLNFVIIGVKEDHIHWLDLKYSIADLKNLKIFSYLKQQELFEYYNKAHIYIQASITEGMPNTLAEAMLFECIPIGSNVNGIPDTIGNTGIVVEYRSEILLDNALNEVLYMNSGQLAREHIISKYPLYVRSEKLIKIFKEYALQDVKKRK